MITTPPLAKARSEQASWLSILRKVLVAMAPPIVTDYDDFLFVSLIRWQTNSSSPPSSRVDHEVHDLTSTNQRPNRQKERLNDLDLNDSLINHLVKLLFFVRNKSYLVYVSLWILFARCYHINVLN